MKTPPFLLGATLLFWGWQTDFWVLALPLAIVLEGSRFIRTRFDFSLSDYTRISDLCTLIFIMIWAYFALTLESGGVLFRTLQWLPVCFSPLAFAQLYGEKDRIDIRAFSLVFRKQILKRPADRPLAFNLTYAYFFICIAAASASNRPGVGFYAGLVVLSAWALLGVRPAHFRPAPWAAALIAAAGLGYAGHVGLYQLQSYLEQLGLNWIAGMYRRDADPYKSATAIGDIGDLKPSGRIIFRVKPGPTAAMPLKLREASYNLYKAGSWYAGGDRFTSLSSGPGGETWILAPAPPDAGPAPVVTVSAPLKEGRGLLKLPSGTFRIRDLPASRAEVNLFGAVRAEAEKGRIAYTAAYLPGKGPDGPPDENDLRIPAAEKEAADAVAGSLGLTGRPPEEALKVLNDFFIERFRYALTLEAPPDGTSALAHFMRTSRAGHCEYFASAATLLLRAAGIPARYATGFLAHEQGRFDDWYVVRDRHAHAWTLVFLNGSWQDFDATPPDWTRIEAEPPSVGNVLSDLWSWLKFKFAQWRWGTRENKAAVLAWLLIPLFLILFRRMFKNRRFRRVRRGGTKAAASEARPGATSAFYRVERKLKEMGHVRQDGETLLRWVNRIRADDGPLPDADALADLLMLHYRTRFDPRGLSEAEASAFSDKVDAWIGAGARGRQTHQEGL